MSVSGIKVESLATSVSFEEDSLRVALADGREVVVPLEWLELLLELPLSEKSKSPAEEKIITIKTTKITTNIMGPVGSDFGAAATGAAGTAACTGAGCGAAIGAAG